MPLKSSPEFRPEPSGRPWQRIHRLWQPPDGHRAPKCRQAQAHLGSGLLSRQGRVNDLVRPVCCRGNKKIALQGTPALLWVPANIQTFRRMSCLKDFRQVRLRHRPQAVIASMSSSGCGRDPVQRGKTKRSGTFQVEAGFRSAGDFGGRWPSPSLLAIRRGPETPRSPCLRPGAFPKVPG